MTDIAEVPGRPYWARDEPAELQILIVTHRLTGLQLRALRELGAEPGTARFVSHSVARALRERGLGEIISKQLAKTLTRGHPQAQFLLNETGRELVNAIARLAGQAPPREPTVSVRNGHLARRGIPYREDR